MTTRRLPPISTTFKRASRAVVCGLLLAGLLTDSVARGAETPLGKLYEQARGATVELLIEGRHGGSGTLVTPDGLIVTAAHILGNPGRRCEVLSQTIPRQTAEFVAVDLGHDLLLLRIAVGKEAYPHLPLAEQLPEPGTDLFLFGAPVFRHGVLQRGMLARAGTTYEYQGHFVEVTQVAALVQEGSSGAAWMTADGAVVGVQSGSVSTPRGPAGIANVAPVAAIRALLAGKQNASTPTLGLFVDEIWVAAPESLRRFPDRTEGMYVQGVIPAGPAGTAGLKVGEVITHLDGESLRLRDDFLRKIRTRQSGEGLELTVLQPDGTGTRTAKVTLGSLEVNWPARRDTPQ